MYLISMYLLGRFSKLVYSRDVGKTDAPYPDSKSSKNDLTTTTTRSSENECEKRGCEITRYLVMFSNYCMPEMLLCRNDQHGARGGRGEVEESQDERPSPDLR